MATGMTSAQIWSALNNDPEFSINFIIDNNPAAVESNLTGQGVSLPANPSNLQLRESIDDLMGQITEGIDNTELISNDILGVPYIDTNPNYTGGMLQNPNFMAAWDAHMGNNPNASATVWASIISGITNAVGGIIQGIQAQNIQEMQQEMHLAQLEYDRDRFESGKIFGIPMVVVLAMIGFMMVVAVLAYKKNK